ncbi:hypothetical protein ACO0M4_08085 [Streptomyces sp. RGM 3693]|uniref:hypothetical protein n=1 Tax=Streptomyces sp. RGM 3693 TaxID=3413284 RepID=UPI003D2C8637
MFVWAKQARLIRVAKGRVHAVAKARPLLADLLAPWGRAFEAPFALRGPLLAGPDGYDDTSMLFDAYEDVLPDLLNTLYSLPYPMPWPRLRESVHLAYRTYSAFGAPTQREQRAWPLDADHEPAPRPGRPGTPRRDHPRTRHGRPRLAGPPGFRRAPRSAG